MVYQVVSVMSKLKNSKGKDYSGFSNILDKID